MVFPPIAQNLRLMAVQYLPWMFIPMLAGLIALWRPFAGALIHVVLAATAFWLFGMRIGGWLIAVPLIAIGVLYLYAGTLRLKWASRVLVGVPVATAIVSGAYPAWIVFTRPSTVDLSMQTIAGNGVDLTWAPAGPGWGTGGLSWFDAKATCESLALDGITTSAAPLHLWRLPTIDEVIRTMRWRGVNAGGAWNAQAGRASYRSTPDKEAPLWNPRSNVIYWWTVDEIGGDRAYRISYNGQVLAVRKATRQGYLAFRCAR